MGNILGRKIESKCKEYKDQSRQCDLDASLRTEVNTLRFTVIKLEDDMFDLETTIVDQEDRMLKFKKNDHRAYPDELHTNPLFVSAKSMN
jgi:hypothetical protein